MSIGKLIKGAMPALAALLSACGDTDGPAVVKNYDRGEIVESLFFSASRAGPVLAHVHGNPFGIDDRALADTVHKVMADAVVGRPMRFTDDPAAVEQPNNHVIVVFGAPINQSGDKLCAGVLPEVQAAREPGRIDVRAVFCGDGELLADAEGWAKRIEGIDDPRFQRLIFDLSTQLLMER